MRRIAMAVAACLVLACGPDGSDPPTHDDYSSALVDAYGGPGKLACAKKCPNAAPGFSCVKGKCSGITSCDNGYEVSDGGTSCVCPTSKSICDGKCVDKNTDPNNCDSCGTVCTSGQCVSGSCVTTCFWSSSGQAVPNSYTPAYGQFTCDSAHAGLHIGTFISGDVPNPTPLDSANYFSVPGYSQSTVFTGIFIFTCVCG